MTPVEYLAVFILADARKKYFSEGLRSRITYFPAGVVTLLHDDFLSRGTFLPEALAEGALDLIAGEGLVDIVKTPHAATRYVINGVGANERFSQRGVIPTKLDECLELYSQLGEEWLQESLNQSIQNWPSDSTNDVAIPASDRIVKRVDNEAAFSSLELELADLREAVRGDNSLDEADRETALIEIAAFEYTISQPCVTVGLAKSFNDRFLSWLAKKAIDGTITIAIKGVIVALGSAFGI